MPPEKSDPDRIFAQPYPAFLELLETDPAAAAERFEKLARPWLSSHPTPSMRSLTAAEQQEIIDETIARCLVKGGEPLRNYTDMWGTFGRWLASVAESTCAARYGKAPVADPGPPAARDLDSGHDEPPASGPARESSESKPEPAARQGTPRPVEPTGPETLPKTVIPAGARRARPSQPLLEFVAWFKSPRVFVPVAILVALGIFWAMQPSRQAARRGGAQTTRPIDILLLTTEESRSPQFDVLDMDNIPEMPGPNDRIPVTAVFRSGRLTVLRLMIDELPEGTAIDRIMVENDEGEVAWDSPVAANYLAAESLNLRIDPESIVPGEYTIRVLDTGGAVALMSVFTIVAQ